MYICTEVSRWPCDSGAKGLLNRRINYWYKIRQMILTISCLHYEMMVTIASMGGDE